MSIEPGTAHSLEINSVVVVAVDDACRITSPVYDTGATESEVRRRWLRYWNTLWDLADTSVSDPKRVTSLPDTCTPPGPWHRGDYIISTNPKWLELDVVHGYLTNSYWSRGIPRDVVERAVRGSVPFGLYLKPNPQDYEGNSEQVGFARVVTDYATFAYVADVFVLEPHRGQGLGVWLIETLLAHPALQGLRRWALVTRDAHGLYTRFGFAPPANPRGWLEQLQPDPYSVNASDLDTLPTPGAAPECSSQNNRQAASS